MAPGDKELDWWRCLDRKISLDLVAQYSRMKMRQWINQRACGIFQTDLFFFLILWIQDCATREDPCRWRRRWKAGRTTRSDCCGTWCAATSETSDRSRTLRLRSSSSWALLWLKSSTWYRQNYWPTINGLGCCFDSWKRRNNLCQPFLLILSSSFFFVFFRARPRRRRHLFSFDRNRTTPLGWNWDEIIFIFVCIYLFIFVFLAPKNSSSRSSNG